MTKALMMVWFMVKKTRTTDALLDSQISLKVLAPAGERQQVSSSHMFEEREERFCFSLWRDSE